MYLLLMWLEGRLLLAWCCEEEEVVEVEGVEKRISVGAVRQGWSRRMSVPSGSSKSAGPESDGLLLEAEPREDLDPALLATKHSRSLIWRAVSTCNTTEPGRQAGRHAERGLLSHLSEPCGQGWEEMMVCESTHRDDLALLRQLLLERVRDVLARHLQPHGRMGQREALEDGHGVRHAATDLDLRTTDNEEQVAGHLPLISPGWWVCAMVRPHHALSHRDAPGPARAEERHDGRVGHAQPRHLEGLEHELRHLLPVLLRRQRRLRDQHLPRAGQA